MEEEFKFDKIITPSDTMPFGKFKGEKLKDLIKTEANYCQWVLDEFDHESDIWKYMNKHKKTISNNYVEKVWDEDQESL